MDHSWLFVRTYIYCKHYYFYSSMYPSVGMTTAFTLGATVFREAISNILMGSLAIPTLILGVVLILSCQQVAQTDNSSSPSIANAAAFTALNNIHTMEEEEEEETIYLSTDPDRGKQNEIEMAIQTEPCDKYDERLLSSIENKKKVGLVSGDNNGKAMHGSITSKPDSDHEGNSFQEGRRSMYFVYNYNDNSLLNHICFRAGANLWTLLLKSINFNEWSEIVVTIKAVGLCVIAGLLIYFHTYTYVRTYIHKY